VTAGPQFQLLNVDSACFVNIRIVIRPINIIVPMIERAVDIGT